MGGLTLLGYSREEHLRLSLADVVRAADLPRLRALIARLAGAPGQGRLGHSPG